MKKENKISNCLDNWPSDEKMPKGISNFSLVRSSFVESQKEANQVGR